MHSTSAQHAFVYVCRDWQRPTPTHTSHSFPIAHAYSMAHATYVTAAPLHAASWWHASEAKAAGLDVAESNFALYPAAKDDVISQCMADYDAKHAGYVQASELATAGHWGPKSLAEELCKLEFGGLRNFSNEDLGLGLWGFRVQGGSQRGLKLGVGKELWT